MLIYNKLIQLYVSKIHVYAALDYLELNWNKTRAVFLKTKCGFMLAMSFYSHKSGDSSWKQLTFKYNLRLSLSTKSLPTVRYHYCLEKSI